MMGLERSKDPFHHSIPAIQKNGEYNGPQFQSNQRCHCPSLMAEKIKPRRRSTDQPNLSLERSLAFSASLSRSRAGAWV
jgi:hypothetical protein